jgi:hypothetical protein
LAKDASSFLPGDCDPIVKEYATRDVDYDEVGKAEKTYAADSNNCHFIPSYACLPDTPYFSLSGQEKSGACSTSCPHVAMGADPADYAYYRYQYNPYDHLKACTSEDANVESVDYQTEQGVLASVNDYDFSPSTRMSWHNAVANIEIDPARLLDETKKAYDALKGANLATQQKKFLNKINPESSINVVCQKDFTLGQAKTVETASIVRNCVVPSNVKTIAGFFVCDTLTIEARQNPLNLIGTFIVGNLNVHPSAYQYGVHWYSIFNPLGARILRNQGFLQYKDADGKGQPCPTNGRFLGVDYWSEIPDAEESALNEEVANKLNLYMAATRLCSPAVTLAEKNQNFTWSSVDPLVGYFDLKNQDVSVMSCTPEKTETLDKSSIEDEANRSLLSRITLRTFDKDQGINVMYYGIELERSSTHTTGKVLEMNE